MLNQLPGANVRSSAYSLVHTLIECRHCGQPTRVVALAVPPGHEFRNEADEGGSPAAASFAAGTWDRSPVFALLFMVRDLAVAVRSQLRHRWPVFRPTDGSAPLDCHWANHCHHCGRVLEDHDLHCEPDVAFVASSAESAQHIFMELVDEPLEAIADGYAIAPQFLDARQPVQWPSIS
jgi:hypothetical protein